MTLGATPWFFDATRSACRSASPPALSGYPFNRNNVKDKEVTSTPVIREPDQDRGKNGIRTEKLLGYNVEGFGLSGNEEEM